MTREVNRREFLTAVAAVPLVARTAGAAPIPIIDTHIHLFDRRRPQGVAWPSENDPIPGISALPSRYRALVRPHDIVGAIVEEASPWLEDNQWVLDQIASDSLFVGTVGFLDPGEPEFGQHLERFSQNELYLGIRYRNAEGRNIAEGLEKPAFISDLKLLADAGLTFDLTADPEIMLRVTDKVPSLRLIIPHLPGHRMPEETAARDAYVAGIRELGARPQVYMKLSEVIKNVDGRVATDVAVYRPWLDELWDIFGEDRVIFGSDWPNSDHVGSFAAVMHVAQTYVTSKGPVAAEKVFWRNSAAAYRWTRRAGSQPQA